MRDENGHSIEKLLDLLLTANLDTLSQYLQGTIAATLVSRKIEKIAVSIRTVLSTALKSSCFLQGVGGGTPFAIRQWIAEEPLESQFLSIASNAGQHLTLRPLISMWLSIASLALLSRAEDYDRRIWFICDELPTLQKYSSL